jgi:restriction system protein
MVPTFDKFLYPVLSLLKDGEIKRLNVLVDGIIKIFDLTEDDIQEKIKSGVESKLHNRVTWATTYLSKAGLIQKPKRAYSQITDEGLKLLSKGITEINPKYLKENYPEFAKFSEGNKGDSIPQKGNIIEDAVTEETPNEAIDRNYKLINRDLADELLKMVKAQPPKFFEELVVDLLVKMGYGGQFENSGIVTRYTKDEGIDGVIKEDKLGLDKIYIQAKRWEDGNVGRKEIQSFVGALTSKNATKGVFITTSKFTKEAREYNAGTLKIVLIDGLELCNYMIEYNLGVSVKDVYEIKRIDSDYFKEV